MSDTQNITNDRENQVALFHVHRHIMHGGGSLPGVYYFNYGGGWNAKQVNRVDVDVYPFDRRDAYYNVYPQSVAPASGKRGTKTNVTGSGGFYCEFDAQDFLTDDEIAPFVYIDVADPDRSTEPKARTAAKKAALTQSRTFFDQVLQRIRTKIDSLPIAPSAILASGGGFHCFWYFAEPVPFAGDDDRRRFELALESWVLFNGGDKSAKDIDRVLRVAGTVNAKRHYVAMAGAPLPVYWIAFDAGRRFSYSDLCAALPATWNAPITERKERQRRTFAGGAPTPHNAGDLPDTPAVRRYNREHKIADELRRAGCTWLHGNRWLSPQQSSNQSSLTADGKTNTAYAFSSHNPVGREGVIRCADIALQLDYAGNVESFLAAIADGLPDFEHLEHVAAFGDIEPLVRQRLGELATIAQKKATAAFAAYESVPTDENERIAVQMQAKADAALAAVTAAGWNEPAIRRFAVGMIDLFAQRASDTVRIGRLALAAHINADKEKIGRLIDVCEGWLIGVERFDKRAPVFTLKVRVLGNVPVSRHDRTATFKHGGKAEHCPMAHYASDAFTSTMTPLDDNPENRLHVGRVAADIRYGRNVKEMPDMPDGNVVCAEGRHDAIPDHSWREKLAKGYLKTQERRFWAQLPSIGERGWLLLTHLYAMGGTATGADLAEALGVKRNRTSEIVAKLLTLEIVTKPDHYTVTLADDWAQQLDSIVHRMPTYGSRARRESAYLQQSILHEKSRMAEAFAVANADPAQVPAMVERIEAIDRSITRRQARQAELLAIAEAIVGDMVREGNRRHPLIADLQRQIGTNEAREKAKHNMRLLSAGKRDYAEKQAITGLARRASWLLRTLEPSQVLTVLLQDGNRERIATQALRYAQGRAL